MLRLIALYKFAKTLLLTAVGLGALKLLQPSTTARIDQWAADLAARHERHAVVRALAWASGLHPRRLEAIAIGAFLFAALFLVEGTGLWLGRRWAQYLTVVATMLFIPYEIFGLAVAATLSRATVLVLNVGIVVLLVYHLRRHPAGADAEQAA